ncbi:sensor histidine kinase [Mucilaginibacter aquaedulcis]|uniref:sensor histidine kinase n=1 Tax=Mucilaginibacter aquaedulcis TaxID=1187081 RepID=UPI0025B4BD2E|nr:HAMP domain-containing sensor histidine kinase [Mucilaginibacter aquaedulcis]MDN3549579.1 HAMP domain-containing sensor histidine kinase [Mucilaginibacter aquaedulcis]
MKLLALYNRVNIITTIIVMIITGILYYMAISWILNGQNDKALRVEEDEVFDYVKLNHQLPQVFDSKDQQISFTEVAPNSVTRKFINTKYHNGKSGYEAGRGLISSVTVNGKYYKILIVESKVETEDLIQIIFSITVGVVLFLLLILQIANRLILNRLWQPFYSILKELKLFNITDNLEITQTATKIEEFNELNKVAITMAAKAKHDYKDLKAFTENASHELLTPIAVINSKLDTLIQTENFSEKQSKLLTDLYSAVSRLSRLNQSLLLLVKIENRLLPEEQNVNLHELITELLQQLEDIFQDKRLTITSILEDKQIVANRYLIEILLSNLIINAVRHNYEGGDIIINLTQSSLTIKNTGNITPLPGTKIFTRFHKSSGSDGSGLGLTISKQICENFNFALSYQFLSPHHTFVITF